VTKRIKNTQAIANALAEFGLRMPDTFEVPDEMYRRYKGEALAQQTHVSEEQAEAIGIARLVAVLQQQKKAQPAGPTVDANTALLKHLRAAAFTIAGLLALLVLLSVAGYAQEPGIKLEVQQAGTRVRFTAAGVAKLNCSTGLTCTFNSGTGAVDIVASGGTPAPVNAEYLVVSLNGTLTNERRLQGTANAITLTDGGAGGDLTLNIGSDVVTLTGSQTLTNKALSTGNSVTAALSWGDGVRQTFNPDGTNAGLNVGSQAGDPSAPSNGDLWYDSTAGTLDARINGATVSLGAGALPAGSGSELQYRSGASTFGAVTSSSVSGGQVTLADKLTVTLDNATTNATDNLLDIQHSSSGTPAASFGAGLRFGLESNTTANQDAAQLRAFWTTATHASRTSALSALVVRSAASLAEAFRVQGASPNVLVTVLNAADVGLRVNSAATPSASPFQVQINGQTKVSVNSSGDLLLDGNSSTNLDFGGGSVKARWNGGDAIRVEGNISLQATDSATNGITFGSCGGCSSVPLPGANGSRVALTARGFDFTPDGGTLTAPGSFGLGLVIGRAGPIIGVRNDAAFPAVAIRVERGYSMFGSSADPTATVHVVTDDAATNANTDVAVLYHSSSGTPAAGFATGLLFQGESSTTANQDMARVSALWTTATHASRDSALSLQTVDNAGSLAEVLRIGDGTPTKAAFENTGRLVAVASTTGAASVNIPTGTAPTSPSSGDLWHDSTQKGLQAQAAGVKQTLSGVLFTQTASAAVTNTTTETTLVSTGVGTATLPANFFVAGKTVRVRARGFYASTGATSLTLRLKLGGTTVAASAGFSSTVSNPAFEVSADITCRTTGGSGTVFAQGMFVTTLISSALTSTAATTIDTTASQAVSLTAQWGAASTDHSITVTNLTVEVVN